MAATSDSRRVVIVGGGFAGLFAARRLGRAPVQVTLIDRAEHHLFQPLRPHLHHRRPANDRWQVRR
jgi:NADH:ubiquinone reductase (H+-translocating)